MHPDGMLSFISEHYVIRTLNLSWENSSFFFQAMEDMGIDLETLERKFEAQPKPHSSSDYYASTPVYPLRNPRVHPGPHPGASHNPHPGASHNSYPRAHTPVYYISDHHPRAGKLHRTEGQREILNDFTPRGGAGGNVLDRCMQHMACAHLIAESMIKMQGKSTMKKFKI